MAKRFTDTGKWGKQSFSELSLKMKLVWLYLCDNCDHAGIWDVHLGLLEFQLGEKVSLEDFDELGDKVVFFHNNKKIFIPSFIEFQQKCLVNELNPENNSHKGILNCLKKHQELSPYLAPEQPLNRGPGIGIGIGIGNKGGVGENKKTDPSGEILKKTWNEFSGDLPKCEALNKRRLAACSARWKEESDVKKWEALATAISKAPWCRGETDRKWFANFDYFVGTTAMLKFKEGSFGRPETHKPERKLTAEDIGDFAD